MIGERIADFLDLDSFRLIGAVQKQTQNKHLKKIPNKIIGALRIRPGNLHQGNLLTDGKDVANSSDTDAIPVANYYEIGPRHSVLINRGAVHIVLQSLHKSIASENG